MRFRTSVRPLRRSGYPPRWPQQPQSKRNASRELAFVTTIPLGTELPECKAWESRAKESVWERSRQKFPGGTYHRKRPATIPAHAGYHPARQDSSRCLGQFVQIRHSHGNHPKPAKPNLA